MNKLKKKAFPFFLLVAVCAQSVCAEPAKTEIEYVIDVVDHHFLCNGYDFLLADAENPIAVGIVDGIVTVEINTPDGLQALSLGEGILSLTENAVPFVKVLEQVDPSELRLEAYEKCQICGRSVGIGYHQKQECGHYGCLVAVDHVSICSACDDYVCNGNDHNRCEHCKVHMCVHENIKCEYMRNPAPTPYSTKVPGGAVQYYQITEDYSGAEGAVGGVPKQWTPGIEFEKRNATPVPAGVQTDMGNLDMGSP